VGFQQYTYHKFSLALPAKNDSISACLEKAGMPAGGLSQTLN
jgi:hypothetical protein